MHQKTKCTENKLKIESFNVNCPDNQAANTLPLSTHCDLLDGTLHTVHAPDKSPRIGA